jgi:hypothetical protein
VSDLAERIDALTRRGRALRTGGRWLVVIGLCLFGSLLVLTWPDPAGHDAINDYVSVPQPLFSLLQHRGAGVRDTVAWLLHPSPAGLWTALVLPIAFTVYAVLRKLIPRRGIRYTVVIVAIVTSPVWLSMVLPHGEMKMAPGARTGILVDHANAPPAPADGTSRPPVAAYWLRPEALPQPMADEARYVLAQQAYLDRDLARMAGYLKGLSGNWHPAGADRTILGLMVEHAAANGLTLSGAAPELAGGEPHSALRIALYSAVKWLAIVLALAGVGLFLIGERRTGVARRYAAPSGASPPRNVERMSAPQGFGTRRRAGNLRRDIARREPLQDGGRAG